MIRKIIPLFLIFVLVGCSRNTPSSGIISNDANAVSMFDDDEMNGSSIGTEQENQSNSADEPETQQHFSLDPEAATITPTSTDRIELMIPSNEFIALRDKVLLQVLGISSSYPVFCADESMIDNDGYCYGGIPEKLGEYTYRSRLSSFELGFDIKPGPTYRLFYPSQGIELDVIYESDQPFVVARYLYLSNSSTVELQGGIGIGSTREDVITAYDSMIIADFHPMATSEEVIALGSEINGIYFVIRNDQVYSIYVATIGEESDFSTWITTKSVGWDLYPEWFYPDREYMEIIHTDDN